MSSKIFKCQVLVGGNASGEGLFCRQAFTFDRAVDTRTGVVADARSEIAGASIKGKVLFYREGKGSTAGSSWLVEALRLGNGPGAVVTEYLDLAAVVGSVMGGILYRRSIPILSGIDAGIFATAKVGAIASVKGDSVKVVLAG